MGRGRSRRCRGNVGVERRTYLRKEPAPRDPGGFSAAQRAPAGELEDLTTAFGGTADLYGAAEAAPLREIASDRRIRLHVGGKGSFDSGGKERRLRSG